ncbi:hypothetical protein ACIQU5_02600 [Streptomyces sp. NPDC090306]|uniref:hypothetical protein n=1 Tax=Streptomyces sp. NPDC090306 TaxID=3365961 RepID=UPI0037F117E2
MSEPTAPASPPVPHAPSVAALPAAVDADALLSLAGEHHTRAVRALGVEHAAGHLVKVYAIEAPGRRLSASGTRAALLAAADHLASGGLRGSLGLATLIVHAGGDGDYVLVHTWIEGYMSDLLILTGPADRPGELRPGRQGLAPCVWEAAVFAHERDALVRHVLAGSGPLTDRLADWGADVLEGDVR